MPLELHSIWVQYPWTLGDLACDAKIVLMEAIIYSSILTIVAFSFERYHNAILCRRNAPMNARKHTEIATLKTEISRDALD